MDELRIPAHLLYELAIVSAPSASKEDPHRAGMARVHDLDDGEDERKQLDEHLARQARAIRGGGSPKTGEGADCNDGRKIALDPRLAGIAEDSPKLVRAADEIAKAFHAGRDRTFGSLAAPGAFQLAFNPGDSQSYGRMRRMFRLVQQERVAGRGAFTSPEDIVAEETSSISRASMRPLFGQESLPCM